MSINWTQVDAALAMLPRYADQADAVVADTMAAVDKIKSDPMYSAEYKAQQVTRAEEAAVAKLQDIRATIGLHVDTIDRNRPAPLGSDDPMAELKLTRAWARAERMLDAGVPVQTVIKAAVDAQDVALVTALREEFPARILAETLDMDEVSRRATVDVFRGSLEAAIARGFAGTDEGRWLAAKLQSDILANLAHIRVQVGLNTVTGDRSGQSMEDAVRAKLAKQDLARLQADLAPAASA